MTESVNSKQPVTGDALLALVVDCWRSEFDHEDGDAIHVAPTSDFFELGGDSLAAMRVAAALGRRLGFDTDAEAEIVLELFERGTPERLCEFLAQRVGSSA